MVQFFVTCIRSRWASLVCLVIVLLAVFLPLDGIPIPLCQFKERTHLPCMGCGLTRSIIGMGHLNASRAAWYHPLGIVLFPIFLFLAGLLPVPARLREGVAAWVHDKRPLFNWFLWSLLAFFLVYGAVRLLYCLWLAQSGRPIPW